MNHVDIINLDDMRNVDIRTVDSDTLTDIRDIKIDIEKPLTERMLDYLQQIQNPYCFKHGKIIVKVNFAETDVTIEECMEGYLRSL
jgi:hypothetical protein